KKEAAEKAYRETLRGVLSAAADDYQLLLSHAEAAPALAYLRDQRGLTDVTIKQWGLGYAPNAWHIITKRLQQLGHNTETLLDAGISKKHEESGAVYDALRNRIVFP